MNEVFKIYFKQKLFTKIYLANVASVSSLEISIQPEGPVCYYVA